MKRLWILFKYIFAQFRCLQWKLAFSYILMTAIALVVSVIIAMGVLTNHIIAQYPQTTFNILRSEAPIVTSDLTRHVSQQQLSDELSNVDDGVLSGYGTQDSVTMAAFPTLSAYTVVADCGGRILVASNTMVQPGETLQTLLPSAGMNVFLAACDGATTMSQTVVVNQQTVLIAAVGLINRKGRLIGVLLTRQVLPGWHLIVIALFPLIWPALTLLIAVVGIIGLIYSILMSRGLVRRFKRVTQAAERWSGGDFTPIIWNNSGDEIGQMTRQLNRMAERLEHLLREQHSLAILEERNRLARDLHDSLKQQMFAMTMQVWSAQAFLGEESNVAAARERLKSIEHLLVQAQQELSSLIHQLRPIALAEKPFAEALREHCERWAQQHGIILTLEIGEVPLALKAEEALFRVMQEALTNIERHSEATRVSVRLASCGDRITLCIADNGRGFDTQKIDRQGMGLLSMRERMEMLGGSLEITSKPARGTWIVAHYKLGCSSMLH